MVFAWDRYLLRDRLVDQEHRWHSIGCAGAIAVLLLVHTSENPNGQEEIRIVSARKASPASVLFTTPVTDKQRRELPRLGDRPNSQIDFSDAPEGRPQASDIQVGRFYRPIKQLVSLRVVADVLNWFRGRGKKYQTYMNEVLRREMQANVRER